MYIFCSWFLSMAAKNGNQAHVHATSDVTLSDDHSFLMAKVSRIKYFQAVCHAYPGTFCTTFGLFYFFWRSNLCLVTLPGAAWRYVPPDRPFPVAHTFSAIPDDETGCGQAAFPPPLLLY